MDPVSSHAPPLPSKLALRPPFFWYFFIKSTISNSPRFEGFNNFENLHTELSKKYRPVIAKSEINFLGFSFISVTLLFLLILATPY